MCETCLREEGERFPDLKLQMVVSWHVGAESSAGEVLAPELLPAPILLFYIDHLLSTQFVLLTEDNSAWKKMGNIMVAT